MTSKFEKELTERAVAEAKISANVMDDPALRAKLLSNPHETLADMTGLDIDPSVKIVIHEETADTFHLVIPPALPEDLTEEQLEAVAGGAVFGGAVKVAVSAAVGVGADRGGRKVW